MKIDNEFQACIEPLSSEEKALLETDIKAHGCIHPLTVWTYDGEDILVDGHHRYEICERLGIAYDVKRVDFPSRQAVLDWIEVSQMGRRNLSEDRKRILRGRCYLRKKHQGRRLTSGHDDQKTETTAEEVGRQFGVSEATVRRDARAVEELERGPAKDYRAVMAGERSIREVLAEREEIDRNCDELEALPVNPFLEAFPQFIGEGFDGLCDSIRRSGLIMPILVDRTGDSGVDAVLLDGRARLRACRVARVMPLTKDWTPRNSADTPDKAIWSLNAVRKSLSEWRPSDRLASPEDCPRIHGKVTT
jgi:hypothetical protein